MSPFNEYFHVNTMKAKKERIIKIYHPLDKLLRINNLTASRACKIIGMTEQRFRRVKEDYVRNIGFNKLLMLSGLLNVPIWELIYTLTRGRLINDNDRDFIDTRIKDLDNTFFDGKPL